MFGEEASADALWGLLRVTITAPLPSVQHVDAATFKTAILDQRQRLLDAQESRSALSPTPTTSTTPDEQIQLLRDIKLELVEIKRALAATAAARPLLQLFVAFTAGLPDAVYVPAESKRARGSAVVQRVLEVTLEELGRVGLAGLSLPHVAALAGINKTSLYRRWPTKQALVTAAFSRAVPGAGDIADHGNLENDLVDLASTVAAFITSPAGMGVMRVVFADGDTPQARRLAKEMQTPTQVAPRVVFQRAIARGELRADADIDLLLHTLGGAVMHRVFVERAGADAAWVRRLTRLLCAGVNARVDDTSAD